MSKEDKNLTPAEKTLVKLRTWIKDQTRDSIIALDHNGKINKQKFKVQ